MSNYTLRHTCFLILLSLFVGLGHGRWKPSRESLQADIEDYRKMTKKIKQELEEYYDEYSDDHLNDFSSDNNKNTESSVYFNVRKNTIFAQRTNKLLPDSSFNESQLQKIYNIKILEGRPRKRTLRNEKNISLDKKWPTFEDILLAIGKKYDWKNDRWIKVKHKEKTLSNLEHDNSNNNIIYHQKHNFIYRIVKLNNAKSKRNVIAVTAVR